MSSSNYTSPSDNSSDTNTDPNINESFITDIVRCEGCEIYYCECCKLIKPQLIDKFCKCISGSETETDMEIE
jgi:hypothetical protein